jgi:hypothetical protein
MITSTLFEDRVTECGGNFENKKRNHREVLKKSTLSYKSFQNKLTTLTFNLGNETNSVGEKPIWLGQPQPILAQQKNGPAKIGPAKIWQNLANFGCWPSFGLFLNTSHV